MFYLMCLVSAVIAYCLGTLSFSYIITKMLTGEDIRTKGSGNAGFTNSMRVLPKKWGILVFVLDVAKGFTAVCIGTWLTNPYGGLVALAFVIIGHLYPFWLGFRGGKGIAAGFGATLAFDWHMAVILLLCFIVVLLVTNYVSAGSVAGAFALVFSGMYYHWGIVYISVFVFCAVLVIYKHRSNIKRILAGNESKVFKNRKWNPLERR